MNSESNDAQAFRIARCDESFPCAKRMRYARSSFEAFLQMVGFVTTKDTCVFASHYLYMVLKSFEPGLDELRLCAGGYNPETGVRLKGEGFTKHMWVGCKVAGESWVLDISADQFGLPGVFYAKADSVADLYREDPAPQIQTLLGRMHMDDPFLRTMAEGLFGQDNKDNEHA